MGLLLTFGFMVHSSVLGDTIAEEPADTREVHEQIARVERVLSEIPDRGAALYFLAAARQHLGRGREAMTLLRECLAMHEGFDPTGSPSLRKLEGSKEFDDLVREVHTAFPWVRRGRVVFRTQEKDLMPEGLAYDARRRIFYLSSLYRRKIVQITAAGSVSDFVPAGRDNLLPVLGIRVDPADGTVWAASWSENSGKSELLHFAASGQLLARYPPNGTTAHGFNDLAISHSGALFVTDSVSNEVFRFDRATMRFEPLVFYRPLFAPNGIALDARDRLLFVADDFGVTRVDLARGTSSDVFRGENNTLAGIDGLYWRGGSLIAVQNGIGSPRIVSFRLSEDGAKVEKTTVLENRSMLTSSPTTGAIDGDKFYFIANSQIDNMRGDDIADVRKLEPVQIGVVELP
jgi:hypothetical protein